MGKRVWVKRYGVSSFIVVFYLLFFINVYLFETAHTSKGGAKKGVTENQKQAL